MTPYQLDRDIFSEFRALKLHGGSDKREARQLRGTRSSMPHVTKLLWCHSTFCVQLAAAEYLDKMQQQALAAVVAWVRLERAIAAFNADLKRHFGITGLQLAVLRILAERPAMSMAALKKALVMHPATLGQSIDELRRMGLCLVRSDPKDRRARLVALTPAGAALLQQAPLAGPVRLRNQEEDPARLDRLAEAFQDAIVLFGLRDWEPQTKNSSDDTDA